MANDFFRFKQFTVYQDACAMKVTTDSSLFGSMVLRLMDQQPIQHVLDIGTGTGLLALMIAQQYPRVNIDAVEIDENAFEQAKRNVNDSPWSKNITPIHADIKQFKPTKKYDLLIANPPFYENELKSADHRKNIAHHQASLDPVTLVKTISENLKESGKFLLLLPFKKKDEWLILFKKFNLQPEKIVYARQTDNHPSYFRMIIKGGFISYKNPTMMESEISIKDEIGQYTKDFSLLLKDYYLHL